MQNVAVQGGRRRDAARPEVAPYRGSEMQKAEPSNCGFQFADDILAKEQRMADILDSIKGRLARKP
jgi:hypothetical protein